MELNMEVRTVNIEVLRTNIYVFERKLERRKISALLKKGYDVKYSTTNNYVVINNTCFNGWTREHISKLLRKINGRNNGK